MVDHDTSAVLIGESRSIVADPDRVGVVDLEDDLGHVGSKADELVVGRVLKVGGDDKVNDTALALAVDTTLGRDLVMIIL